MNDFARYRSEAASGGRALKSYGLCAELHTLATRYGLLDYFRTFTREGKAAWSDRVRAAVRAKETREWIDRVESDDGPHSRWYSAVKSSFRLEPYLSLTGPKQARGRRLRTQMRTSSAPLQALKPFWELKDGEDDICRYCDLGEPEEQVHAMRECPAHAAARARIDAVASAHWLAEREAGQMGSGRASGVGGDG